MRLVLWLAAAVAVAMAMLAMSVVLPGTPTVAPRFPSPPPGMSHLTEQQAIESATGGHKTRADAQLMDYSAATAMLGEGPDPKIDPTAEVWLVTVYRPATFTVILDSVDGSVIDSCLGCRAL
ncbi:MAG TPA: hypothetical protein VKY26_13415 [Actinomycetota bacterium]|nr:hypothetical protein [Actinomycetota bacterium]